MPPRPAGSLRLTRPPHQASSSTGTCNHWRLSPLCPLPASPLSLLFSLPFTRALFSFVVLESHSTQFPLSGNLPRLLPFLAQHGNLCLLSASSAGPAASARTPMPAQDGRMRGPGPPRAHPPCLKASPRPRPLLTLRPRAHAYAVKLTPVTLPDPPTPPFLRPPSPLCHLSHAVAKSRGPFSPSSW